MGRINVVKRPYYAVGSVDSALRVLLMLQERDGVRVSEVAARIDAAPSTAHRILSTLVYRGFAEQDESRRYYLGPAMKGVRRGPNAVEVVLRPRLVELRAETGETVSAMVLEGVSVRILLTVESRRSLRITDRGGTTLPAAEASAGKAMLAHLGRADLERLYSSRQAGLVGQKMSPRQLAELEDELTRVRTTGVAYNLRRTEIDLVAVGCAVRCRDRAPWLGLAISVPVKRSSSLENPRWHAALWRTADRVAEDLVRHGISGPETRDHHDEGDA